MNQPTTTTIAALATAPYPAGLAVVRISGSQARAVLRAIFLAKHHPVDDHRRLVLGKVVDHRNGQVIDSALAVYMPGPQSFTGEDIAEIQFHGGPLLVERILQSLSSFGIVPAEPGEFSKRAFLNGKMDLTQAEAIADVINATSKTALKLASEQLQGKLKGLIDQIAEPLRNHLAELEAGLDFSDEDIEPGTIRLIQTAIEDTRLKLHNLLGTYAYGHVVRRGYRVLLCGRPNAGKSSLLNTLLGKKRAIVTEIAGTTRDLIEEEIILGGYRFVLCDTAGLHATEDVVEKIGIEQTLERLEWADLIILIADATDKQSLWRELLPHINKTNKPLWLVVNKIDLAPDCVGMIEVDSEGEHRCSEQFYLSTVTHGGIEAFKDGLVDIVKQHLASGAEENFIVTSERHRDCLARAESALSRAAQLKEPELLSFEIRSALTTLEELVGRTYTEDILGRIFSKFCVGK